MILLLINNNNKKYQTYKIKVAMKKIIQEIQINSLKKISSNISFRFQTLGLKYLINKTQYIYINILFSYIYI